MTELVVATRNKGKIRELQLLLEGVVDKVIPITDFADAAEVVEDGATFEENAVKKAREATRHTGLPALADDSGLVVSALGGRPGVHSARFAGEDATDADNNRQLLDELTKTADPDRSAAFHCVIAYCTPDGDCRTFSGMLPGIIIDEHRGSGGFGYDPLFLVPEYGKTLSELSMEVKNRISHRGRALRLLAEHLRMSENR